MTPRFIPYGVRSLPDAVRHHRTLVSHAEVVREFCEDVALRETRPAADVIQQHVDQMIADLGYVRDPEVSR